MRLEKPGIIKWHVGIKREWENSKSWFFRKYERASEKVKLEFLEILKHLQTCPQTNW